MTIRNLDKIFRLRSVAVLGASDTPAKVGNTVLRNLVECGFAGDIFPVNAKHDVVQGRPAFRTIANLPGPVDLAVSCTPAPTVPTVVRECGDVGILGLVILTAGFRETGAADRVVETLIRFSYLSADHPEIHECDINPVLATADDVIALDARIVIRRDKLREKSRPYAHLAIRPYPDEFVREASLKDGTRVLLRPIKPEDEPAWHALVAACSQELLFSRFGYLFRTTTHEMATRFCFLDYDRETAIIAEFCDGDQRRLVGVGRLIADVDHQSAEFAVLVIDAW